jgi:hypothetical protein
LLTQQTPKTEHQLNLFTALAGSRKTLIQTSGSSIIADLSEGKGGGTVYDEDSQFTPPCPVGHHGLRSINWL